MKLRKVLAVMVAVIAMALLAIAIMAESDAILNLALVIEGIGVIYTIVLLLSESMEGGEEV